MENPVTAGKEGVKIVPEKMDKEKLYHCIFKDNILLVFKDNQDILNCYQIEEKELVDKIKECQDGQELEKIFVDYIEKENLKH